MNKKHKLTIASVTSGQKSPRNCMQILSSPDLVLFSCARGLELSN